MSAACKNNGESQSLKHNTTQLSAGIGIKSLDTIETVCIFSVVVLDAQTQPMQVGHPPDNKLFVL